VPGDAGGGHRPGGGWGQNRACQSVTSLPLARVLIFLKSKVPTCRRCIEADHPRWHSVPMSNIIALPPLPARISAKLRHAVALMAREGRSQTEAATVAGLSRQGLAKAISRPAVRDLFETERLRFISEADGMRAYAKARAILVALDLMQSAKSETVRARMAEFLASDARAPSVAIHVDARQDQPATGYVYHRPPHLGGTAKAGIVEAEGVVA